MLAYAPPPLTVPDRLEEVPAWASQVFGWFGTVTASEWAQARLGGGVVLGVVVIVAVVVAVLALLLGQRGGRVPR